MVLQYSSFLDKRGTTCTNIEGIQLKETKIDKMKQQSNLDKTIRKLRYFLFAKTSTSHQQHSALGTRDNHGPRRCNRIHVHCQSPACCALGNGSACWAAETHPKG
jgi:hypothetical protein